jgi:hypothetical protein
MTKLTSAQNASICQITCLLIIIRTNLFFSSFGLAIPYYYTSRKSRIRRRPGGESANICNNGRKYKACHHYTNEGSNLMPLNYNMAILKIRVVLRHFIDGHYRKMWVLRPRGLTNLRLMTSRSILALSLSSSNTL